jgi:tetratricopeptide (TPR) repeat protein
MQRESMPFMSQPPSLSRAAAAWNAGQPEAAVHECRRLLDSAPEALDAWNLLGLALYRLKRAEEAEAAYRSGLAVRPRADLMNNLGLLLKGQDRFNEAMDCFQAAIRLAPRLADGYANLGRLLRQSGNAGGARAMLARAVALNPDLPLARSDLGGLLFTQGLYEEAAAHFRAYLTLSLPGLGPDQLRQAVPEKPKPPLDPALYRLALEAMAHLLDAAGIPFFLCAGTALGCVREGGFISQDKDIDLGLHEPVERGVVCRQLEESAEFWFDARAAAPGLRHMVSARYRDAVAVDLFFHREEGGRVLHGISWNDHVVEWELSPFVLEPVDFAGGRYQLPAPAGQYLSDLYGDWRTPDEDYCGWVTGHIRNGWPAMARAYCLQDLVASLGQGRISRASSILRRMLPRLEDTAEDRRFAAIGQDFLARLS